MQKASNTAKIAAPFSRSTVGAGAKSRDLWSRLRGHSVRLIRKTFVPLSIAAILFSASTAGAADLTITDNVTVSTNETYGELIVSNVGKTVTIGDGVTLTINGTSTSTIDGTSLTLDTNRFISFTGNENGDGKLVLSDTAFQSGERSTGSGFGVVAINYIDAALSGVTFNGNKTTGSSAALGGGLVFQYAGTVSITDSTFTGNEVTSTGGYAYGGGLGFGGTSATITNTNITGNKATSSAAGVHASGGGLAIVDWEKAVVVTVTGGSISNNLADNLAVAPQVPDTDARGGGIAIDVSGTGSITATFDGVEFTENTVTNTTNESYGGAIYNNGGTLTVKNSTFTDNTVTGAINAEGGAIWSNADFKIIADSTNGGTGIVSFSRNTVGVGSNSIHLSGSTVIATFNAVLADDTITDEDGISGEGGIFVTGLGTTFLNGTNTFIGEIEISDNANLNIGGWLAGEIGDYQSDIKIGTGGTITFSRSTAGAGATTNAQTFSGDINGAEGFLIKSGDSTLTLTGSITLDTITVSDGTLNIGSAISGINTISLSTDGQLHVNISGDTQQLIGITATDADANIEFSTLSVTNSEFTAGFMYNSATAFKGSLKGAVGGAGTPAQPTAITVNAANGSAAGLLFGDIITSAFADIEGTINVGDINIFSQSTAGASSTVVVRGLIAKDITENATVTLGDVSITATGGSSEAAAVDLSNIAGSLETGAITVSSAGGSQARGLNVGIVGGTVLVDGTIEVSATAATGSAYGVNVDSFSGTGSLEVTGDITVTNASGFASGFAITKGNIESAQRIDLQDITVTATTGQAIGLQTASGTQQYSLDGTNVEFGDISTTGDTAYGIYAGSIADLTINSNISATGNTSYGILTTGGTSNIILGSGSAIIAIGTTSAEISLAGANDTVTIDTQGAVGGAGTPAQPTVWNNASNALRMIGVETFSVSNGTEATLVTGSSLNGTNSLSAESGGKLILNGTSLTNGGAFTIGGAGTVQFGLGNSIAATSVTIGSGTTLAFDMTGAVNTAGSATTNLTLTGATLASSTNIDLASGLIAGHTGNFRLVSGVSGTTTGSISINGTAVGDTRAAGLSLIVSNDTLLLTNTGALVNGTVTYAGASAGNWNQTEKIWTGTIDGATVNQFLAGDTVVFDTAGTNAVTIDASNVTIAGMEIKQGNWTFTGGTINNTLSGTQTIAITGDASVAFDTRTINQRIAVSENVETTISATNGNTVTFSGKTGTNGGAIGVAGNYPTMGDVTVNLGSAGSSGTMLFTSNTATYGGAVDAHNVNILGGTNTFGGASSGNRATAGHGGAIGGDTVVISAGTNTFSNNTASQGGGAIGAETVTISGGSATFSSNTAGVSGGAIYSDAATGTGVAITANNNAISFTGNSAGVSGGAIYANSDIQLTTVGTGSITFSGNVVGILSNSIHIATAGKNLTLDVQGTGTISDSSGISGAGNLVKSGSGTATLSGYNTYTGDTTVSAGKLVISQAFDTIGDVIVANGATLGIVAGNSLSANSVNFNTSGKLEISGYTAGSTLGSNSVTVISTQSGITGFDIDNVTIAGQATVDFLSSAVDVSTDVKNITVTTGLTWNSNDPNREAHGDFTVASGEFTLDAALNDNSASTNKRSGWDGNSLTKLGSGSLLLTAVQDYTGATSVSAGTLRAGISNVLANSSNLSISSLATFDLNGFDQEIQQLANAGTINLGSAGLYVSSGSSTGSIIGDDDSIIGILGDMSIGGDNDGFLGHIEVGATLSATSVNAFRNSASTYIYDTGALSIGANAQQLNNVTNFGDITGSGKLVLGGNNFMLSAASYTGGTDLLEGSYVTVDNDSALGTGVITVLGDGATLAKYASASERELVNDIVLGNYTLNLENTDVANDFILSGVISNAAAGLNKLGQGDIILAGANTYTGPTSIYQGTLIADNNQALGSGDVIIDGGTLQVNDGVTLVLGSQSAPANVSIALRTDPTIVGESGAASTGMIDFTNVSAINLDTSGLSDADLQAGLVIAEHVGGFDSAAIDKIVADQFLSFEVDADGNFIVSGGGSTIETLNVLAVALHSTENVIKTLNTRMNRFLQTRPIVDTSFRGQNIHGILSGKSVWVNYIGWSLNMAGASPSTASEYEIRSNGVQVGADIYSGKCTLFGIMFGYEGINSEFGSDNMKADDYYFGLYGLRTIRNNIDLRAYVGYAGQNFDTSRVQERLYTSDFKGRAFDAMLEIGRSMKLTSAFTLRPFLGATVTNSQIDGAEENTGNNSQRYGDTSITQVFFRTGLDAMVTHKQFGVQAGVHYAYQLASEGDTASISISRGNLHRTSSVDLGDSVLSYNVGGNAYLNRNRTLNVFGGYYGDAYTDRVGSPVSHTGVVGIESRF